jgi:SPOR domain
MRQHLGEYEDYQDSPELMGEDRADEYYRPHRRWPAGLLTIFAMVVFAGGLWFAYVQGTRHPAPTSSGDGVPLLRADDRPTKVKPDQPGGMSVPDQNVSLYSEKPGGAPVEKLLPGPEQPMARPAAPPKEAAAPPPPIPGPLASAPAAAPTDSAASAPAAAPAPAERPSAASAAKAAPRPAPAAKETTAVKEAAAILGAAPSASANPKTGGEVRVQLGALRSAEAARNEWARLKREQPKLLGKLSAVAVRADLGDKGIFYRIQAGPLSDGAAAERLCGELRQRKLGCTLAR